MVRLRLKLTSGEATGVEHGVADVAMLAVTGEPGSVTGCAASALATDADRELTARPLSEGAAPLKLGEVVTEGAFAAPPFGATEEVPGELVEDGPAFAPTAPPPEDDPVDLTAEAIEVLGDEPEDEVVGAEVGTEDLPEVAVVLGLVEELEELERTICLL